MRSTMDILAEFCAVFTGLFLFVFVLSASADDRGIRLCADDIAKFCKGIQPGGGRIAACLKEHQNDLSASCKGKMAEARQKGAEMNKACHDDAAKFCKDVKPGGGRIVQCLKQHSSDLSIPCKEALPQGPK
ncbi:MAG: cysteine rich repeat-containing protein [Nitrospirae bacterium]|nr:cysteine rich repeat-containing protein [Nitrospirota bacterium]